MKTTKQHFEVFKGECQKWIDILKLDNWDVHYRWYLDKNSRGSCSTDLDGYVATLELSKEWRNYDKLTDDDIKQTAKHEVIHLLLARLSQNARARYVSSDDLGESEEELVRKLEKIIK